MIMIEHTFVTQVLSTVIKWTFVICIYLLELCFKHSHIYPIISLSFVYVLGGPNMWAITSEERTKHDKQFDNLKPSGGYITGCVYILFVNYVLFHVMTWN